MLSYSAPFGNANIAFHKELASIFYVHAAEAPLDHNTGAESLVIYSFAWLHEIDLQRLLKIYFTLNAGYSVISNISANADWVKKRVSMKPMP